MPTSTSAPKIVHTSPRHHESATQDPHDGTITVSGRILNAGEPAHVWAALHPTHGGPSVRQGGETIVVADGHGWTFTFRGTAGGQDYQLIVSAYTKRGGKSTATITLKARTATL